MPIVVSLRSKRQCQTLSRVHSHGDHSLQLLLVVLGLYCTLSMGAGIVWASVLKLEADDRNKYIAVREVTQKIEYLTCDSWFDHSVTCARVISGLAC